LQYKEPILAEVFLAKKRIRPIIYRTPLVPSSRLAEPLGTNVFLKLESLQVTGSFKIRGAANKLSVLSENERQRGVITVSSGNHGRAVAYVAKEFGVQAVICVSEAVPDNKIRAIRELGAEIVVAGKTYDEANEFALQLKDERRLTMVHPFDDADIIAGQGTIGLELMDDLPEIDTVIVPLSGGGLLSGVALALKSIKPSIHTVGVTMDQGAAMVESLKAGHIVEVQEQPTLADALAGGLGEKNLYTFNLIQKYVDETVLVSESEIASAMVFALDKHHLVVEGGGAVGIAALMHKKVKKVGENTVIVISGSGVDLAVLLRVAQGRGKVGNGN
jgi:threonine dehydratase